MKYFILLLLFSIAKSSFGQNQTEQLYQNALIKAEQKDFQYAAVLLDKALSIDSTNIDYLLKRADIQFNMKGKEAQYSIDYILKAIAIDSTKSEPYNRAGNILSSLGEYNLALLYYEKAIHYSTSDTLKHSYILNRGAAHSIFRQAHKAIEDFEIVLKFNPDNIGALNNVANAYEEINKSQKAIKCLNKIISLDKNFLGAYVNLGFIYTKLDSLEQAMYHFNQAINISKDSPLLYNNRGFTYYKMGEYNKALKDINQSIRMYPTNSYAYKNLALVYLALGSKEEACTALSYAQRYNYAKYYGDKVEILSKKHCNNKKKKK